jgi:hypothetical protein
MRYGGFFKFRESATCRVCGETFRPVRFDAITCTDTCRKRLQRGGAFAYLADLSPMERRAERKRHALHDQTIDSTRKVMAERRERLRLDPNRPLRVQKRQKAAERKRVAEEVARQQRRARAKLDMEQQRPRNDNLGMVVVGAIMLFVKQRRNDFSAEAITAMLDMPEHYPLELVAARLARLHADGDFDRIVADAAMAGPVE